MKEDLLSLDRQICFPLYALSRVVTALYRPILDEFDLTYPQYLVLLVLWEKDGIPLKEIGDKLLLDSGTLTPLLKKMESQKFLTRERSEEDERSLVVKLTTKGRNFKKKAECIPERLFADSGLTQEKVDRLKRALDDLLVRLAPKLGNSA
ncbi:MarR family winged helix-turn-helix transcriptional regulator [Leptospira fletcheri]|uniref:MarR family winged helix-turn-helix transcriptional regulator n=1 Tax=Leptospira fletcheri TaxID=2484981 RepID=UPI001FE43AAF|nr:MarR family transcriptional regulator [Leptospira fletcheri]